MDFTVAVIAKAPRPGRSKTRLSPPLGLEDAASLAEAALADTLAAVATTPAARRVVALDGPPGPWLPPGFDVLRQRGTGLADRLASLFADTGGPTLLIGMDTPQVTPSLLEAGGRALLRSGVDAVLGPADDGGYWAIGLRDADPGTFSGVPMSTPTTGSVQLARLHELELTTVVLPGLRDVDDFDDAVAVARLAPHTRFAAAMRAVATRPAQTRAVSASHRLTGRLTD